MMQLSDYPDRVIRHESSCCAGCQRAVGAILADLAFGRIAATHEALDQHPRPRAAGHLRQMLVVGAVLPHRDEELVRA